MTPVKFQYLEPLLKHYRQSEVDFLKHGFKQGFSLQYTGTRECRHAQNLLSAKQQPEILLQKISKEIALGRIAGPFSYPPFDNLRISPLGLVPKKDPGEFRVIHHLSYPAGQSINDGIPSQEKTVQYESLDHAISLIQKWGTGALLAKTDIESAFRIIPVHPKDHELLGMQIDNSFYYDKCLPMGCATSCNIFERFSTALHWILEQVFNASGVVHVLDDFLFVGPPSSQKCNEDLQKFLSLCNQSGVPIKESKTVNPTTCLVFLGIELDTCLRVARLPQDKIHKIRESLTSFLHKKKATLKELQSLLGLLNFACQVVIPGRPFLRRLIDLTKGLSKPNHHVRLNREAKLDLHMWSNFIEHFNGVSMFLSEKWESSNHLSMFTDASNLGYAAILGKKWFFGSWSDQLSHFHINIKELFPITVALELWGQTLRNRSVLFFSDNAAVVAIINKQTSKEKHMMILVRRLVLAALRFNIHFRAKHIPGKLNVFADYLSRLQVDSFRHEASNMDRNPTQVPSEFLKI